MPKIGADLTQLHDAWDSIRESGQFTEGRYVRLLEDAVSEWSGLHAVAVNSGGTGLYAMLRVAKQMSVLGNGRVAVPNNTFFATGAMVREVGNPIVLIDSTRSGFSMGYDALRFSSVGESHAVILTHVGGMADEYMRIAKWCGNNNIAFFEDAAHVLGVGEAGHTAGQHSFGAVFSLYPTKAIPAGEGGVIVTKDPIFAERLKVFRNYGKWVDKGVIRYSQGFNFRMDEWTAAVAYLQMKRRKEIQEKREAAAFQLMRIITPMCNWGVGSNWYKYPAWADEAEAIGIKRFTGKIYQRSDQLATAMGLGGEYPNSEWLADKHVCLPVDEDLYAGKTKDQIVDWLRGK